MTARILVAGIGNIFLGDDGFGSEVVRNAEIPQDDPSVRVIDYGIRGMHLAYDLLEEWDTLVLVDAVPSRGNPGTLHVFQADHEQDPRPTVNPVPAQPVWTLTAWIRPRCSPACGPWGAVRPTRSSSGARRAASRKASASPSPWPRPFPAPRGPSRKSSRRCKRLPRNHPLREDA